MINHATQDPNKLLIITPYIPAPVGFGGIVSQFSIIDSLRNHLEIDLLVVVRSEDDKVTLKQLNKLWPNVALIQYLDIQESKKNKVWNRIKRKLKSILVNYNLYSPKQNDIPELYNPNMTRVYHPVDQSFHRFLMDVFEQNQYNLIQVDFFEFISLLPLLPEKTKKIFIHHELRYMRLESNLRKCKKLESDYDRYMIDFVKYQELSLLGGYDKVGVFSDADIQSLGEKLPKERLFLTKAPVPDNVFSDIAHVEKKYAALCFIGAEGHQPNKDALLWYISEIGDLMHSKTGMVLYVAGDWSDSFRNSYADKKWLEFVGFVDDLKAFVMHKIMLVPVRYGSGIRMKILYAMAYGVPVISTQEGADGINLTDGNGLVIANTPDDFIKGVERIISDVECTERNLRLAHDYVKSNHAQSVSAENRLHSLLN